eukprot:Selendium_serpulae@DN6384_c6_g2_i5.p1
MTGAGGDASAAAAFAGSNTATAFVNEIVRNVRGASAFEIAALSVSGKQNMLYVGDGTTHNGVKDIHTGTIDEWDFLQAHLSDFAPDITGWDMASGYAVLTDKTSGEILSSITWGATPIFFVDLTIKAATVTVYPLVVLGGDLEDEHGLAVTGLGMENKSTGTWAPSTDRTLGSANEGQSFKTPVNETSTVAPTVAPDTGSGHKSKIGVLAVMGSMALVLSS